MKRIVAVAFFFRLAVVFHLFRLHHFSFDWGANETGMIARSLLTNHAYGPAFQGAAGPTAWVTPVYPLLLAGIFAICGVRTTLAAAVAALLNCALAAFTVIPIYKTADCLFGHSALSGRAGKLAAVLFATCPYEALIPYILWETTLSGFVLAYAVLLTLLSESGQRSTWWSCGAIWGIEGLISPAMLAPFPFLALWLWWRTRRWQSAAIMTAATLLVIFPWVLRNQIVLHDPVLRSNGWAEIYFGNIDYSAHPANPGSDYRRLGEEKFTGLMRERVLQYVAQHPAKFAADTLKRTVNFWRVPENFFPLPDIAALLCLAGVILAVRGGFQAFPCVLIFLCCPVVYYLCYSMSRYRYPIEPIMWVFAGYFLVRAWKWCGTFPWGSSKVKCRTSDV